MAKKRGSPASNLIPVTGAVRNTDGEKAAFSFEYLDQSSEQPTQWEKDELCRLLDTLRKASQLTWYQIRTSGGKVGSKSGLGFTKIDGITRPAFLRDDETITEMRISQRGRVFGVRRLQIYYIFQLDRNHRMLNG